MKSKTRLGLFILSVGLAPWVYAQTDAVAASPAGTPSPSLDLATAELEAIEHSPDYQKAINAEKEASWEQVEAFTAGFLPHLSIGGKYFFDNQYPQELVAFGPGGLQPFLENFPIADLSVDATFDLFDGFQNIHQLDAANNQHESAKLSSQWASFQLTQRVRLAYYNALAKKELADTADQNVKTLQDHQRVVKDQLDNGQATQYDLLSVNVKLSRAQSDQISAHDNVVLAREALANAMGYKADDRVLSGTLPILNPDEILSRVNQEDYENRPDLKAKKLTALAAQDRSAAAESFWIPKVQLIGDYTWYNEQAYTIGSDPMNTGNVSTSYFVGAAATWNLLDGGQSWAQANAAQEQANESIDDFNSAKLRAPFDFDIWKRTLVSKVALYRSKLTEIDESRENSRLAILGFKAGTRTTTDVLDAELDQFQAEAGLVQAQVDALEALINLENTVGKRISHE